MQGTFELLRLRLLLKQLDKVENSDLHTLVIREAKVATELARATAFPWLLFPCLFEERVHAALQGEALVATRYWRGLNAPERLAPRSGVSP
jgi:hypothetical protein